jgi:hypothetical protein
MNDPGSLQNLNDIVVPAPVAWWPPAPGWYVLVAVVTLLLLWLGFRGMRRWQRNRYRREALRALDDIVRAGPAAAAALPELLKRVALSAWPRGEIAELVGADWHRFLDRSAGSQRFGAGAAGRRLEQAAYAPGGLGDEAFGALCEDTAWWIRHHRPPGR